MGRKNASFACKYFFFKFCLISNKFSRSAAQEDVSIKVSSYSTKTATSTLQSHLLKHHAGDWVQECKHLKIQLRGKEGKEALAMFIGIPMEQQVEARRPFSQENFLGALILFIIATDQVFFSFKNLNFFLIFSLRQLGLWRDKNSANFASSFALSCMRGTFLIAPLCTSIS